MTLRHRFTNVWASIQSEHGGLQQACVSSSKVKVGISDWTSIDRAGAAVVEMGEDHGLVSHSLGKSMRHLGFIMQDLPSTAEQASTLLPPHFHGRVKFPGHDPFTEQIVRGPNVHHVRWILHNWSDGYAREDSAEFHTFRR